MSFIGIFRQTRSIKRFAVDSAAHSIFYGIIGGIIALSLGIEFEVYVTMSIIGTAIQFLSGGFFGKFLDLIRNVAKV